MTADPTVIVEPILIGLPIAIVLLILLGLYLTRPSDPAALSRHQRVSLFVAIALVAWFAADFALAQAGVFELNATGGPQSQALVPKIAIGISLPLLVGLAVILTSRRLGEVLARVPQSWIIGVQLYRVVRRCFSLSLRLQHAASGICLAGGHRRRGCRCYRADRGLRRCARICRLARVGDRVEYRRNWRSRGGRGDRIPDFARLFPAVGV